MIASASDIAVGISWAAQRNSSLVHLSEADVLDAVRVEYAEHNISDVQGVSSLYAASVGSGSLNLSELRRLLEYVQMCISKGGNLNLLTCHLCQGADFHPQVPWANQLQTIISAGQILWAYRLQRAMEPCALFASMGYVSHTPFSLSGDTSIMMSDIVRSIERPHLVNMIGNAMHVQVMGIALLYVTYLVESRMPVALDNFLSGFMRMHGQDAQLHDSDSDSD